jgi:hypothetical protein
MADSERRFTVRAAHRATKGIKRTHAQLKNRALSRTRIVGPGVNAIAEAFSSSGPSVEAEFPIDKYNVDLLVGRVAVEVTACRQPDYRGTLAPNRLKQIAKRGYSLVYVVSAGSILDYLDDVIALIELAQTDPASRSEYRMFRCRPDAEALGRNDLGQFTSPHAASDCD